MHKSTESNGVSKDHKSKSKKFNVDKAITGIMENFAFYMIGVIIIYFFIAFPELIKFHQEPDVIKNPFDFSELVFVLIGFLFCFGTFHLLPIVLDKYVRSNLFELKGRYEPEDERVTRLINNFHSLLYYLVSFTCGFLVTWNTMLLPKMMGGHMDLHKSVEVWPQDTNRYVRWYFLFTLGHHIERQVNLWTHKRKSGDFWTLNLHHILTVFLMIYSYSLRLLHFGVPVVMIHDISDINYNISKLCRCLRSWRPFLGLSMAIFTFSWLYTRIICYTKEILLPLKHRVLVPSYIQQNYFMVGVFEVFCLYVLGILDYYWFALIVKIGFNLTRKNDAIINEER